MNGTNGYKNKSYFFIQILIQNPLNHIKKLIRGLIGYAQQDISFIDYQTTKYGIHEHEVS